ncbi:MAG: DegT/DnrJ/EryC1/StrS family aminotransferase [Burkholderiales bacterium]
MDVPVFRFDDDPAQSAALAEAALRVLGSKRYVLGDEVAAFERELAAWCGARACIGVGNGTDALELALRACGVQRGDRVAMAANAGYYAATAARAIGAVPAYVDVGSDLVMTRETLGATLGSARAVVVTHLYGRMADVEAIVGAAREAGVPVVEDCAQAHGAARGGRMAGTIGDAGCFSFYPTKNLGALGDGGAVVTSDEAVAQRVRALRQYGWDQKYRVAHAGGGNSRLDELQAAFLRAKLPRLAQANAARVAIAQRYREGLAGLPVALPQWRDGEYVAHLFVIRCRDREALRASLARAGIGTDIHYPIADHEQPVEDAVSRPSLPVTEAACRDVLTLPCFPGLRTDECDRVIAAVRAHYGAHA